MVAKIIFYPPLTCWMLSAYQMRWVRYPTAAVWLEQVNNGSDRMQNLSSEGLRKIVLWILGITTFITFSTCVVKFCHNRECIEKRGENRLGATVFKIVWFSIYYDLHHTTRWKKAVLERVFQFHANNFYKF